MEIVVYTMQHYDEVTALMHRTPGVSLRDAPPFALVALLTGFSNTALPGAPLPLALDPVGALGCSLLTSSEVVTSTSADGAGRATVRFQVPSTPGVRGLRAYQQFVVVDAAANALGLVFTQGASSEIARWYATAASCRRPASASSCARVAHAGWNLSRSGSCSPAINTSPASGPSTRATAAARATRAPSVGATVLSASVRWRTPAQSMLPVRRRAA